MRRRKGGAECIPERIAGAAAKREQLQDGGEQVQKLPPKGPQRKREGLKGQVNGRS